MSCPRICIHVAGIAFTFKSVHMERVNCVHYIFIKILIISYVVKNDANTTVESFAATPITNYRRIVYKSLRYEFVSVE